jgi:malate dehydrogenase
LSEEQVAALTKRIQFGGDEVVQAKNGAGSATLSMAFAGARFVNAILDAKSGKKTQEYAYLQCSVMPGVEYFSTLVEFGPEGADKIHPLPALNATEKGLVDACVAELKGSITKGTEFVQKTSASL